MLPACGMHETRPIADSSCLSFRAIQYSIPPRQADGTRELPNDPRNAYDSLLTIMDIVEHNARWQELCGASGS